MRGVLIWMATLALPLVLMGCDIDVKDEGSLPDVDVEGGEVPEVEVRGPEIDVEMEERTVEVPDVDVTVPEE